jgi:hypothetical protein
MRKAKCVLVFIGAKSDWTGPRPALFIAHVVASRSLPRLLRALPAQPSRKTARWGTINNAGQIVGQYHNASGTHGFLFSGGTYTTIDVPGTRGTALLGINDDGQITGAYTDNNGTHHGFLLTITPDPPPSNTTAVMILRGASASATTVTSTINFSGQYAGYYEIYDIGNNAMLAAYQLGRVGTDWGFVTLGGFFGSDTADMLLRSATTGGFEVYDISNNNITNAAFLGNVGLDWQVMGFGNFSSRGETDMILRNANNGGVEVYDLNNNQITGASFLGTVGLDWQFSGVGNFSGVPGESDLLLRNSNTGGLEVYNIANNQLTGAAFIGTVGLDWQFAGVAPVHAAGASDLILRNVNTGQFESTTSRATLLSELPAWARSAWIGSSAALRPIPRPAPWVARAQPLSSCRRWRASAVAAAQVKA